MAYSTSELPYGIKPAQGELQTAFLYNIHSRKGKSEKYLEIVKHILAQRGMEEGKHYLVVHTLPEGKTIEQARLIAEAGYKKMAIGSGDGGIFEGLNGIVLSRSRRPAVLFLPVGTSCDVAQSVGMAYTLDEIDDTYIRKWVDTLVNGVTKPLDLLSIESDNLERKLMSADAISFGIEPDILQDRVKHKDDYPWPFNQPRMDYGPSIFKKLLQFGTKAKIEIERSEGYLTTLNQNVYGASIQNTQVYAGSFVLGEGINWQDGLGDLFVFSNLGSYLQELAKQSIKKLLRKTDENALRDFDTAVQHGIHVTGKEFRFNFEKEVHLQIDGEPFGKTSSCVIRSHPAEVRVICPRD